MLIQLDNGVPVGHPVDEKNFRMLFKNTSFPDFLTPDIVEDFGFGVYEFTRPPEPKRFTKVIEDTPIKGEDGIYRQSWKIVAMTDSEINSIIKEKESEVRNDRNMRLFMCDWTQASDVLQISSDDFRNEWADYRHALRHITEQEGFPWDIRWPTPPTINK